MSRPRSCSRPVRTALAASVLLAGCETRAPRAGLPEASGHAPDGGVDATLASEQPFDASPGLAASRPPPREAGSSPRWDEDCGDKAAPRSGKSVGHTSVVFKLELSNGRKVAWKPNARRVKGRYKAEIAAWRLAKALGIDNVLPACPRAIDRAEASAALASNAEARRLLSEEAIVDDGRIRGAAIPWLDGLKVWPLEDDPLRSEAKAWLAGGEDVPPAKADLARQVSTLVAFDFITGNWDRYSGGNVGIDPSGTVILYLDNDAAFAEAPPKDDRAHHRARLEATARFSRTFVAKMRALDRAGLTAAFGDEEEGRPLLSPTVIGSVALRMKELSAVIDAKIAARGERETLYFP